MVKQILALHADIGAAKNIVKNCCILDENIFFPRDLKSGTRLDFLKKFLYPTDYKDWFGCEYQLKNYSEFGIEMDLGDVRLGGLIPPNALLADILKTQHFICDIMDHGVAKTLWQQNNTKVLSIAPLTMFGLNWQIRAYTMKYGAARMFNFTFHDESKIKLFKQKYGEHVWIKVNLVNFYDMVRHRRRVLKRSGMPLMPMEWIIYKSNWSTMLTFLDKFFELQIPRNSALEVLEQWASLHWPVEFTNDWEHRDIFKTHRTAEITDMLRLCDEF